MLLKALTGIMFCGCGMGFGLLKGLRDKDTAGKGPASPPGPRVLGVDPPHLDNMQHQLVQLLHPLHRLNALLPKPLREKVFEPVPKPANIVAEKVD